MFIFCAARCWHLDFAIAELKPSGFILRLAASSGDTAANAIGTGEFKLIFITSPLRSGVNGPYDFVTRIMGNFSFAVGIESKTPEQNCSAKLGIRIGQVVNDNDERAIERI